MGKDIRLKISAVSGCAACKESTEPGKSLIMQKCSKQNHVIEAVGTSIVEFHLKEDFVFKKSVQF